MNSIVSFRDKELLIKIYVITRIGNSVIVVEHENINPSADEIIDNAVGHETVVKLYPGRHSKTEEDIQAYTNIGRAMKIPEPFFVANGIITLN
jgi:hypothetical protein